MKRSHAPVSPIRMWIRLWWLEVTSSPQEEQVGFLLLLLWLAWAGFARGRGWL